jgi:hypothetical protein
MLSLGAVRFALALIAALLLPLEAASWDLEASRDPARYFGVLKLGVASAGTALLAWGLVLRLIGRPGSARRLREALLIALGALAALCWFNFFQFHQGVYLHTAEIFHHYVGSKYFRELSYSRLYDCTVVADYGSGYSFPAHKRPVRRLGSNRIDWATDVLADPEVCTDHFSPQRWRSFQHDVGWFRAQFHPRRWASITTDRGFNSTPMWNTVASLLADTGPPSTAQILTLALLDPLLLLVMWGFVAWAFGWRTLCVALVYWGTNYPALFGWTGGAFLRQDWLASAVIGLCLLRRGKLAAGGAVLTLSVLLRMTPAILIAGLVLKVLGLAWRERSLTLRTPHRRFAAGCVAALVIALPLSALVGGAGAWADFARNTQVDLGTPSGNFMGWRTVVSYEHETRMELTRDRRLIDSNAPWQQARRDAFQRRQLWFWAAILGFLVVLLPAARQNEDWVAAVLGVGLMVVGVQIPSYYYALLLAYAFLWQRSEAIGVGLCALSAASWLIAGAFSERDEIFNWVSLASVLFVIFATLLAWRSARLAQRARRASRVAPG